MWHLLVMLLLMFVGAISARGQVADYDSSPTTALSAIHHGAGTPAVEAARGFVGTLTGYEAVDAVSNVEIRRDLTGIQVLFVTATLGCSRPAVPQLRELAASRQALPDDVRIRGLHFEPTGGEQARREALLLRKVLRADFPYDYSSDEVLAGLISVIGTPAVVVMVDGSVESFFTLSQLHLLDGAVAAGSFENLLHSDVELLRSWVPETN